MSTLQEGDHTPDHALSPLNASESEALGLPAGGDDHVDLEEDTLNQHGSPPPPAQPKDTNLHKARSEHEAQIEITDRRDEVEPTMRGFRVKRDLHRRQMADTEKRIKMVGNRIDKLNADVEKLRNQWGEVEREKATLLVTNERYMQKKAAQQKIVWKDDKMAQKYHEYVTLAQEVLVLDDSDDEEENEDSAMYDWKAQGQASGGGGEDEVEHV